MFPELIVLLEPLLKGILKYNILNKRSICLKNINYWFAILKFVIL